MPDQTITEVTHSDAPGVDDSLFGDAADVTSAGPVEGKSSAETAGQDGRGTANTGDDHADEKSTQGQDDSTEAVERDPSKEAGGPEELKVVISIKGDRAIIGVRHPSSDPHIESLEAQDLTGLAQVVPALVERARARWVESPKHPVYERPAPPAKRRSRRQKGPSAQTPTAEDAERAHPDAPRLF